MKKIYMPLVACALMITSAQVSAQKKATKPAAPKAAKAAKAAAPAPAAPAHDTVKKTVVKKKHVVKHKPHLVAAIEESETIQLSNNDGKTVIDINNGGVYVNGELVSTINDAKKESHKIVIEHEGDKVTRDVYDNRTDSDYPPVEIDEAPGHKLLLGVFASDDGDMQGARVRSVVHASPADEAGLQQGDIIVKVGGMEVHNAEDLVLAVNDHDWGESISITYIRDGHRQYTRADLGEITMRRVPEEDDYGMVPDRQGRMTLPDAFMESYRKNYYNKMYSNDYYYEYTLKMGIVARNADNGRGVVVTEVKPNSPAELAGLMKGDVITWLDHQRTRSVDDIHLILSYSWPNERMKVVVKRDGEMMVTHMYLAKQVYKKNL